MRQMNRRQFLKGSAALGLATTLPACSKITSWGLPITVYMPGMEAGHRLRGNTSTIKPSSERRVKVAVLGSGAAGSFAAWRLAKSGIEDFVLVEGPEVGGNCASGQFTPQPELFSGFTHTATANAQIAYPRGAHYLPLPSMESKHVRELLADMGVIEANPFSEKPTFDERYLVHSPEDRLFINGQWQEGITPKQNIPAAELAEQHRFFQHIETLKHKLGSDGKRLFCVPIAHSSQDPQWQALDQISFAQWLKQQQYTAPSLLWYLDYACRDDYGINLEQTSAWAGLHYFASRGGQASNAHEGAVLTWPDGLQPLIGHLHAPLKPAQRMTGTASQVQQQGESVWVDVVNPQTQQTTRLIAEHVICAMPLHVAAHIVQGIETLGFQHQQHASHHAAWQVSNFLVHRFPEEPDLHPLAWDNVVFGSSSLGYVNSTHQLIRTAKPEFSVFTAYHAYSDEDPKSIRQRLLNASADELFDIAVQDLDPAYGWRNRLKARQYVQQVEITLRGHAMSSPTPGFLHNQGIQNLIKQNSRIQFAHSDLSGLSIFEEASWWGDVAAKKVLDRL